MRKTTLKDIAARANVSVATVSYVLNKVAGQSIPPKTQELIRQIAEELHYVPNLAARSLGSRRTGLVGLLIHSTPGDPFWKQQAQTSFIRSLERRLTAAGYHVLLLSIGQGPALLDIIALRRLDAVLVVDVPEDAFYPVSRQFVEGVPLIVVDGLIDDPLFHQVVYDYRSALADAMQDEACGSGKKICLVTDSYHNNALNRLIADSSGLPSSSIYTVADERQLDAVITAIHEVHWDTVVVINEFLACPVAASGGASSLLVIPTGDCPAILGKAAKTYAFREDKSETAFKMLETLLHHPEQISADNLHFVR